MLDNLEDALADLKAKALKATPGPWELTNIPDVTDILVTDTRNVVGSTFRIKNAAFIAAANPATVLALIAEIEELRGKPCLPVDACYECQEVETELRLENERLNELVSLWRRDHENLGSCFGRLEKEADWLAKKLAEVSGSMFDDELEDLGLQCAHECGQPGCSPECRKRNWREAAQQAISKKGREENHADR